MSACWRRAFVGGLLGLIALPATVGHAAITNREPALTVQTTVAGRDVSPLVQAAPWEHIQRGWRTHLRVESPPAGRTEVLVKWRSPTVFLRHGQSFFSTDEHYEQQGAPGARIRVRDSFRICFAHSHRCTQWFVGEAPGPPAMLSSPPFITFGSTGWGKSSWTGQTGRARVEWRFSWIQTGVDYADISLQVTL